MNDKMIWLRMVEVLSEALKECGYARIESMHGDIVFKIDEFMGDRVCFLKCDRYGLDVILTEWHGPVEDFAEELECALPPSWKTGFQVVAEDLWTHYEAPEEHFWGYDWQTACFSSGQDCYTYFHGMKLNRHFWYTRNYGKSARTMSYKNEAPKTAYFDTCDECFFLNTYIIVDNSDVHMGKRKKRSFGREMFAVV